MQVESNDIMPKNDKNQNIYLNIDHLKDGHYTFNIMLDNKVVKSFRLTK